MKLGIIIICKNNENDIDVNLCTRYLKTVIDTKFCLVNNSSEDKTHALLERIKDRSQNVSVVNIKKMKSDNSAVKAGARFMFNQFTLDHIGFVNANTINNYEDLSLLIKTIRAHRAEIINYHQEVLNTKAVKLTQFQSLFPVIDYLEQMKTGSEYA